MKRSFCIALPFVLALLAFTQPQDGKSEFEQALAQVHERVDAGRWKDARSLLLDALEAHVGEAYVRERRDEVRSLLADCAFELAVPNRGVEGVFCGEVKKYDAEKGALELRWDRPKPKKGEPEPAFPCEDFERTDRGLLFRAPFVGPHVLELSGREIGQDVPHLIGCSEGGRCYDCALDAGSANTIERVDEKGRKQLGLTTDSFNVGRPYTLKLSVDEHRIEADYNGKRMVQAEKVEGEWGRAGFRDVLEPKRIELRGQVDPAWIETEIAAVRKKERAAFDETHDADAELPEWLRE